ncbi:MAG: hypothetical protein ABFQ62_03670, partial [Patescibacteria group bacterium]
DVHRRRAEQLAQIPFYPRQAPQQPGLLIEPDREFPPEVRFDPWYELATKNAELFREKQIGVLKLETWKHK